jgi:hypothetical protein
MNFDNVLIDLVKKYRPDSFIDLNSAQAGPSISTYQKPSIDITVIDFERVSSHFGWAISFKITDEQHRNYHIDTLPTNKAFVADNGNWYEFDNDKLGAKVENPSIRNMILEFLKVYIRDMQDSIRYIEGLTNEPKRTYTSANAVSTHSIMYNTP